MSRSRPRRCRCCWRVNRFGDTSIFHVMALSEVPRRKATGPRFPRRLWLDFRRGLDGGLVRCPDLQSRHNPASPWRMRNSRALPCMRGGAGVGGVRFGFGCNDQNGRSEGAPSRASNGCVRDYRRGGDYGGRPCDEAMRPPYFRRRDDPKVSWPSSTFLSFLFLLFLSPKCGL
jgi:hypothetical protein